MIIDDEYCQRVKLCLKRGLLRHPSKTRSLRETTERDCLKSRNLYSFSLYLKAHRQFEWHIQISIENSSFLERKQRPKCWLILSTNFRRETRLTLHRLFVVRSMTLAPAQNSVTRELLGINLDTRGKSSHSRASEVAWGKGWKWE